MDTEKLKALALAAKDWTPPEPWEEDRNYSDRDIRGLEFSAAACPAAVLELIAEVERLRADEERLDFVDRSGCAIRDFHDQRKNVIEWIAPDNLRNAIDAAIEKEKA